MADKKKTSSILIPLLIVLLVGGVIYYLYDKSQKTDTMGDTAMMSSEPEIVSEDDTISSETSDTESSALMEQDESTDGDVVRETEVITFSEDPATEPVTDNPIRLDGRDSMSLLNADGTLEDRTVGDVVAPIKVIEYSSLTCSHCATFHTDTYPKIKENYIDTGKVEMIFREFPLNKPALEASQILRCMPEDKYLSFQELLFETQENWAFGDDYISNLKQNAKLAGMSEEEFNSCLENKELQEALTKRVQEGSTKWDIKSTPTFVINNGDKILVGSQPYEAFEKAFNSILGEQPTE